MVSTAPNAALLAALGRLVRGLSAIFWGLPAALVIAVQTLKGEWFKAAGFLPATIAMGLLLYGVQLLGGFQPQERIWRQAWERARLVAMVNVGLAPFLFFWSKVSAHPFFLFMVQMLLVTSLLFLYLLNSILLRLSAMLPDETLREESRLFTRVNQVVLLIIMALAPVYFILRTVPRLPSFMVGWMVRFEQDSTMAQFAVLLVFVLLPVAMTMALVWKTKEIILAGVFSSSESQTSAQK